MLTLQVYNPYLEAAIYRRSRAHQLRGGGGGKSPHTASTATTAVTGGGSQADGPHYKFYDVDTGATSAAPGGHSHAASSSGGRTRGGATERFYDEVDYDKRLRKRRVRLVTAVEEAFAHIRRVGNERSE